MSGDDKGAQLIKWPVIPPFDPSQAFTEGDTHKNVRRTDPDTSRGGTEKIKSSDKTAVFGVFRQVGADGLTDRELRAHCPHTALERVESWRKRRSDLAREGALVDSTDRRDGQIVWCLAQHHAEGLDPAAPTDTPQSSFQWGD
jgi:hypothetical protein